MALVLLTDQVAQGHCVPLGATAASALRTDSLVESGSVVKKKDFVFVFLN